MIIVGPYLILAKQKIHSDWYIYAMCKGPREANKLCEEARVKFPDYEFKTT